MRRRHLPGALGPAGGPASPCRPSMLVEPAALPPPSSEPLACVRPCRFPPSCLASLGALPPPPAAVLSQAGSPPTRLCFFRPCFFRPRCRVAGPAACLSPRSQALAPPGCPASRPQSALAAALFAAEAPAAAPVSATHCAGAARLRTCHPPLLSPPERDRMHWDRCMHSN